MLCKRVQRIAQLRAFRSFSTHSEWRKEEAQMDTVMASVETDQASKERFYPSFAEDWKRVYDREAGDDDADFVQTIRRVPDTKLLKVENIGGKLVAVKTASAETVVDILKHSQLDAKISENILSRIEYLSSTLSVKKIRLILAAIADSKTQFEKEELHRIIHVLGQELLCRYHSMTLLSCASISASLAKLNCRDTGLLNVVIICFKQILEEGSHNLSDERVTQYASTVNEAFIQLKYQVGVLDEVMSKVTLRNQLVG